MSSERSIDRVRRAYVAAALLLLNTLVLFVAVNVAVAAARAVWHRARHTDLGPEARVWGVEHVARAYPGWRRDDLLAFLRESNDANLWRYEPFTLFRPAPARGRFINVANAGYREGSGRTPWPPSPANFNVFWFGGSTAFGVGLPDDQTIAARLQHALGRLCGKPVAVYNFGRPAYYSIQEGVLLQRLLRGGGRPDLAVFLDGLNDFGYDEPATTPALTRMVDEANHARVTDRAIDLLAALPVANLPLLKRAGQEAGEHAFSSGLTARQVVDRWLQNRRMLQAIAQQAGAGTLFVWQPVPNYHYDVRHHLFADRDAFAGWGTAAGYALVDRMRTQGGLGDDFLWLADLQANRRENLYVDRYHYDAKFSAAIADAVAAAIRERSRCPAP
jgi:hypothetical protein